MVERNFRRSMRPKIMHKMLGKTHMPMLRRYISNHYNQHNNRRRRQRRRLSHPSSFIVQRINKSSPSECAVAFAVNLLHSLHLWLPPSHTPTHPLSQCAIQSLTQTSIRTPRNVCKYIVPLNNDLLKYCFVVFAAYNVSLSIHIG